VEDCEYESDFWEWLDEGMSGQRDEDHEPVQGFVWDGAGPTMHGETVAQQKGRQVQEALFSELY
jgi:hypothetical protein